MHGFVLFSALGSLKLNEACKYILSSTLNDHGNEHVKAAIRSALNAFIVQALPGQNLSWKMLTTLII